MADTAVTEFPDYPRGLTFEQVWASIKELRESQKEWQVERQKEWERKTAEWEREDAERQREAAERQKEWERKTAEWEKEKAERQKGFRETKRMVKETSRQMGLLNNSFGELAEHLVAPGIMDKFNELGFNFTRCGNNVKIKEPGNPKTIAEIDILLENGDIVIAVEVKAKSRIRDVEEHIERMEKLLRSANKKYDNRIYRGAIAAAIMSGDVRRSCLENGFYVIEQAGDTMKIDIPPGFVPREWKLDTAS